MMSGFFLVRDGRILWRYHSRHSGDLPAFDGLPAALERALTTP
jgi:hypothetical protein